MADVAGQWIESKHQPVGPRLRTALSVLGIVAAEFPDSDLIYSGPVLHMGSLGYLLHHRGHTHTLVWAIASAVLLWLVARWWVQRPRGPTGTSPREVLGGGAVRALLALAVAGTVSHIVLDWTNSYGVHPFWPFDGRWFYGDAVFIVEPWLWLIAIPALFFNGRSRAGRVLLSVFFVLILAATVLLGQVARDVMLVLVGFAVLWPLVQRVLSATARVASGIGLWVGVTLLFFLSSTRAKAAVREQVDRATANGHPEHLIDVVLNPGPGDVGCWSVLVVTAGADTYRVSSALVAPYSARDVAVCAASYASGRVGGDVLADAPGASASTPFASTSQVQWRRSWSQPRAALQQLVRDRCEARAALYFMRTPVWFAVSGAAGPLWQLSDARYGVGGGGFSELTVPVRGACTLSDPWIPAWTPPRGDLVRVN